MKWRIHNTLRLVVALLITVRVHAFSLHGRLLEEAQADGSCAPQLGSGNSCFDQQDSSVIRCDAGCPEVQVTSPACDETGLIAGQRWHMWSSDGSGFSSGLAVMRTMQTLELPEANNLLSGVCTGAGTCAEEAGTKCGKLHTRSSLDWEGAHVHLYENDGASGTKKCLRSCTTEVAFARTANRILGRLWNSTAEPIWGAIRADLGTDLD